MPVTPRRKSAARPFDDGYGSSCRHNGEIPERRENSSKAQPMPSGKKGSTTSVTISSCSKSRCKSAENEITRAQLANTGARDAR
jgi:hypothetical protein